MLLNYMEDLYEQEIFYDIEKKCENYKNNITMENMTWKQVSINDVDIGDYIYVKYYPYSLRDLYTHKPEIGKVISNEYSTDAYSNNIQKDIKILNYDNEDISINKGYLCYYSSGYDMEILKLIITKKRKCSNIESNIESKKIKRH